MELNFSLLVVPECCANANFWAFFLFIALYPSSTPRSMLIACGWGSSFLVSPAGFLLNLSGRLHVPLKVFFHVGFSRPQAYCQQQLEELFQNLQKVL